MGSLGELLPGTITYRRTPFLKAIVILKSNIQHYLFFLESYLFRAAIFSNDLPSITPIFSEELLFTRNTFSEEILFHSYASFS